MTFDVSAVLTALPHLAVGLLATVYLVVSALLIGALIGLICCAGRLMGHGPLSWLAKLYVDMFRGLPETILIFWVYFCGPFILEARLSAFASGVLSLSLISGAHLGEILRAGVLAVPAGQRDAANALGLALFPKFAFVIGPQAFRIMLPAFFSHLTILIKNSAIVSAVGVAELFYVGNTIANDNFKHFEVYTAIGLMYLALILPISIAAKRLERGLAVGRHT